MAWDFMAPTRNLELGFNLAAFLKSLDDSDYLQMMQLYYPSVHRPSNSYWGADATATRPRGLRCDLTAGTLILLQGVKRNDTAAALLQAWGAAPDLRQYGGCNSVVREAALAMYDALSLSSTTLAHNVLIAGHSFGGAVAQALAAMLKSDYPSKSLRVVSFGAPRAGPAPWVSATRNLDHARYWSHDDPIVFCPPRRSEAYNGHAMLTTNCSNRWDATQQTGLGITLYGSGNARLMDYPAGPPEYTDLNLVGWATGLIVPPVEAHSIHEYYLRVSRSFDAGINLGPMVSGGYHRPTSSPPTSPPVPTTPPPAVVAAVDALDTARTVLRTTPNPHVFEANHLYGVWGVYRDTECITVCASRASARRIANVGNQMLRQATARGVNNDAEIARVLGGML